MNSMPEWVKRDLRSRRKQKQQAKRREPFSNKSIVAPVKNKPHICIRQGWWRVSAMPKYASITPTRVRYKNRFYSAHDFVRKMNSEHPHR